ncbi:MAG TPA: hypothetical protein VF084_05580 [Nitrososphaeraceae archaeon]
MLQDRHHFFLIRESMPKDKHTVSAGIDYRFLNNYFMSYNSKTDCHYE